MSKNGGKNWRDDWCTEAEDAQVGIQWEFDHPDFINSASCKKEAKYMEKLIGDRTMKLIVKWPTKWCKGKAEVIAKALIAGVSPPEAERLTDKWIKDQIQNADIKQNQQVVEDFCFAGHVPVRLADGTSKRFDKLVKGDSGMWVWMVSATGWVRVEIWGVTSAKAWASMEAESWAGALTRVGAPCPVRRTWPATCGLAAAGATRVVRDRKAFMVVVDVA